MSPAVASVAEAAGLHAAGRVAEAETLYRHILHARPDQADALHLLGVLVGQSGNPGAGAALIRKAAALRPGEPHTWTNLGFLLREAGALAEALAACRRAVRLAPALAAAHHNRAIALLQNGDYAEGWREYGWRWQAGAPPPRALAAPAWQGEPLAGRTILLHAEQGMGDTLNFIRYAPLVAARGGRVVLEVQPPLVRLLARLPGVAAAVGVGEALPAHDLQAALPCLPGIFATTLATIPGVPYLAAAPALTAAWRARLAGPGPMVGLVWAGNPEQREDRWRSPRLAPLLPLLERRGVRFFGLQLGDGRRDLEGRALPGSFTDLGPEIGDFEDTAAIMAALDLVISSDTSALHLAGALGCPTWALLARVADWRWLTDRSDSPWYPTLRLYRQEHAGDWAGVVARVGRDLDQWAAGTPGRRAPANR